MRLELTTPGLEVRCAIQLRHEGNLKVLKINVLLKGVLTFISKFKDLLPNQNGIKCIKLTLKIDKTTDYNRFEVETR